MNVSPDECYTYRSSFTPYNQKAPGFDYVSWKPYGYWRQEDNNKSYIHQARALAPWVRSTADSGIQVIHLCGILGKCAHPLVYQKKKC